jgi:nucleoside phosphorylase
MAAKGLRLVGVMTALLVGVIAPPAGARVRAKAMCASTRVLLLGSYPAELSANLSREKLDPGQPTTVAGHEFYLGRLERRRVILGIAGQSPADTYGTTALALGHFSCISAVVFSGTAGGHAGESEVGDVTAASRWTADHGKTFKQVGAKVLAVARSIAGAATSQLGDKAAVNDGPCACSGVVNSVKVVPTMRSPKVIVGGNGTTYGGESDVCFAQGGELAGCNPCPPGPTPTTVPSTVTAGATTSLAATTMASLAAKAGVLVHDPAIALSRHSPPAPSASAASTDTGTTYMATDQQTTAAMAAAEAGRVPFIAFRGISDTDAVGNLWPFEFLVYQQLAADNAAVAARLWIGQWNGHPVPAASAPARRAAL